MKKRWLGILLALCLLVCLAPAALAAETEPSAGPTEVYVSNTGSDENGDGSKVNPYATLATAVYKAQGRAHEEAPPLPRRHRVLGGQRRAGHDNP